MIRPLQPDAGADTARRTYTDDDLRASDALLGDVMPDASRLRLDIVDYSDDERPWLGKAIIAALVLHAVLGAVGYWLVMP